MGAIAKGVWNGHGVRPKHKKKNKKDQMLEKEVFFSHELELELEAGADEPEEMARAQWESFVEDNMGAQSVSQNYQDLSVFRKKEVDLIPMTIADAVESLQFPWARLFHVLGQGGGRDQGGVQEGRRGIRRPHAKVPAKVDRLALWILWIHPSIDRSIHIDSWSRSKNKRDARTHARAEYAKCSKPIL